jgi:ATP-dependent exoDNAse (exonuclease V) beta subunit
MSIIPLKKTPDYLSIKNKHIRDDRITFDEGPHIYTVDGEKYKTSVTGWIHSHFSHFDSDKIVDKMIQGQKMKDPTYKYYGMTKEQILADWDKNRDSAAQAGTNLHYDIECYYNEIQRENTSIEYQYFLQFSKDFPYTPYRTEWVVFYDEYKLCGSIDMVFENPDGTLLIYDWKRCKEIEYEKGIFTKYATTPCISHLPDTNFWHYSLQLNIYKTILEHKYGKKVVGLFLVCLHPDNPYKTYDRIEVQIMEEEMAQLLEHRKREIST